MIFQNVVFSKQKRYLCCCSKPANYLKLEMDISIVVPLFNEEESLRDLAAWIAKVMQKHGFSYEVLMVDDGSDDGSWDAIEELCRTYRDVKGLRFKRNYGKSAALHCGFQETQGDVIITMDADLQDSPEEIPELFNMIQKERYDIVSGWKKKRYDPFIKRSTSKVYNYVARKFTGIDLHDMNCGLKAYRSDVVKSIEVYGEMHRYIPVIAKAAGYKKIGEKVVEHRARQYGYSKFGLERFVNGLLDLLSVTFITRFAKKPMHLFGALGILSFLIGFGILTYFAVGKLFFEQYNMTSRPLFFLGFLSVIFGTQLFLTGFLAELVSRSSADRNEYLISKRIKLNGAEEL